MKRLIDRRTFTVESALLGGAAATAPYASAAPRPRAEARYGTKPYTRWWWFSQPMRSSDVHAQLDWLRDSGFGGVEIAWVYPLDDARPGVKWLGEEWRALVVDAKTHADAIGLGCDFTFGTLWPFGGSHVSADDAIRTFDGLSSQRLSGTWETPDRNVYVVDHLSAGALRRYAAVMGEALRPALRGGSSTLFCDSLELDTARMWTRGLWPRFESEAGYDLQPFTRNLSRHADVRYDYRRFVGRTMIREFFREYTAICHELGAASRVQCAGAPVDLLSAYAEVDVPETESLLFNPPFSRIAASAAAMTGKSVVSAEAFTCMYGFRNEHMGEERIGDIKLVADAIVAHGVNHFFWHGTPFSPPERNDRFYATIHVGKDCAFVDRLPAFNAYLSRLAETMRRGKTLSRMAVYLPNEDAMRLDELPVHQRTPGAGYHWEMRYVSVPEETRGFAPIWISETFLEAAVFQDGKLRCGQAEVESLYIDCEFMDAHALRQVVRLATAGLPVVLRRSVRNPGHQVVSDYAELLRNLRALPNVFEQLTDAGLEPLLSGEDLPAFWPREDGEDLWLFFAHPLARKLAYPMPFGYAYDAETTATALDLSHRGRKLRIDLSFAAHQSIMLRVRDGEIQVVDLGFVV